MYIQYLGTNPGHDTATKDISVMKNSNYFNKT